MRKHARILTVLLVALWMLAPVSPASSQDMVVIPGGEFFMGSFEERDAFEDERPLRKVYVGRFAIDRHEITNAEYARFVAATGHRIPENPNPAVSLWKDGAPPAHIARHPVINIAWDDAVAYCRWLGKRLPTEAEWEKAARGTDGRRYPWGNEWDLSRANSASYWAGRTIEFHSGEEWQAFWVKGDGARISKERGINGEVLTMPVGSFPEGASPYGLHDMAGNASEWVQDWYGPSYYAEAALSDPAGPERGVVKSVRGGSWLKPARSLRTSDRDYGNLQARPSGTGFRCAKDER